MADLPECRPYPAWSKYVVLPVCKTLCRVLFWVLGRVRSIGRYRIPRAGPLLILCNHLADVDPIVVQIACPRAIHFMAKSELFDMPVLGHMIRWFQAFPVKRGEPDRAAMRHAIDLLKMGEVVSVFPEGQLSEDGELQELKPGVALIVRKAAVPVLCCGIRNTNRVLPYGRLVPRVSWTTVPVVWGEVKCFPEDASTEDILGWATAQLRELTHS